MTKVLGYAYLAHECLKIIVLNQWDLEQIHHQSSCVKLGVKRALLRQRTKYENFNLPYEIKLNYPKDYPTELNQIR